METKGLRERLSASEVKDIELSQQVSSRSQLKAHVGH